MPMDDDGLDSMRSRRAAATGDSGVPLHDPDLPEPERADALDRARAAGSSSSPPSTTCSCSRTTRTASSASTASRCRALFELSGGEHRLQLVVLEDDRARRCASAGSSCPRSSRAEHRGRRDLDVHHAASCSARRPCYEFIAPRQLRAEPRAGQRPAEGAPRRDARGARTRPARGRDLVAARRRLLHLARASDGPADAAELLAQRGGRASPSSRAPTSAAARRTPLRLAFSFVSPEEIAEGVARARSPRASGGAGGALAARAGSRSEARPRAQAGSARRSDTCVFARTKWTLTCVRFSSTKAIAYAASSPRRSGARTAAVASDRSSSVSIQGRRSAHDRILRARRRRWAASARGTRRGWGGGVSVPPTDSTRNVGQIASVWRAQGRLAGNSNPRRLVGRLLISLCSRKPGRSEGAMIGAEIAEASVVADEN